MKFISLLFCLQLLICGAFAVENTSENWQQQVDFQINVRLYEAAKLLEGDLRIRYINNSPDTLREIYLHVWPNAYSRYNTALARQLLQQGNLDMDQSLREDLGSIYAMEYKVDDIPAEFVLDINHPDIGLLRLNTPLPPGGSVEITTPFKVDIPKILSRLGYEGNYFAISQWYPKPAVYDRDGWHPMPYLDQGEFYSDFGKYVVSIDVPGSYDVAATGKRIRDVSESGRRTLIYEQENIIDFAWFASPDFRYEAREVLQSDGSRVVVQVYNTTEDGHWDRVLDMAENALRFYDEHLGPYPYEVLTIAEGPLLSGSGMEYPTITVIRNTRSIEWLEVVVVHEIGHNYWQAALANNEREHPWIDEGFASYYEKRYLRDYALRPFHPQTRLTDKKMAGLFGLKDLTYDYYYYLRTLQPQRLNTSQALSVHPERTTERNYGHNHYFKMPMYVRHIASYMGQEMFDDCMRTFYREYVFRHIRPADLQDHLESCSGKDLQFMFARQIGTARVINGKIARVSSNDSTTVVRVRQLGIEAPVEVTVENDTASKSVWLDPGATETRVDIGGAKRVLLDPDNTTLDYDRSNNYWKSRGIHKLEKISPFLLGSVEQPQRSQFFLMPVVAGNSHDKFLLGLAVYNRLWPAKNIDWNIVPFYAFGSRQANGIFNFSVYQNIRKERSVQIGYHIHFKTFSYDNSLTGGRYLNFAPSIKATILPADRSKNIRHELSLTHHQNWLERSVYDRPDSVLVLISHGYVGQAVGELRYTLHRDDVKTPISVSTYAFNNLDFMKIGTELNFKIRYGKIKSYVHGRFFLEGFLFTKNPSAASSNGYPSYRSGLGGTTGSQDYLFDDFYLGRSKSDGLVSRQVYMDRGQFKFASPNLLRADALVTSVNIRADFPSKWVPIQLYMDFGIAMNEPASGLFAFQAGGILTLFDQAVEIYFPFFSSSEISNYYDLNVPKYKHRISFSFDMDKLNLHKKAREYVF